MCSIDNYLDTIANTANLTTAVKLKYIHSNLQEKQNIYPMGTTRQQVFKVGLRTKTNKYPDIQQTNQQHSLLKIFDTIFVYVLY